MNTCSLNTKLMNSQPAASEFTTLFNETCIGQTECSLNLTSYQHRWSDNCHDVLQDRQRTSQAMMTAAAVCKQDYVNLPFNMTE